MTRAGPSDAQSIGEQIKRLRTGLYSQRELADAAGLSVDLIRKLEQGRRHTASVTSLHKIALALDVDVAVLLQKTTAVPGEDGGIVAIRRFLTNVDDLLDHEPAEGEPLDLADAEREITYSWGAYWSGRYPHLAGRLLPGILARIRAMEHAASARDRPRAAELLAEALQITGCVLVHLGHPDAAWQAMRAAVDAAGRGSDELRDAALRGSLAWLLLTQGRVDESCRLATKTAEQITPPGDTTPMHLSVWGSLLLTGATAAGRDQRAGTASQMLTEASEVAKRIGCDRNDYETAFGPSQVVMQTVDVQVVGEDFTAALGTAKEMPRDAALPLAARSRHLTDVAYAHVNLGHDGAALDALTTVEQHAPDWIHHQTLVRQVVRELLERERRRTPRLRGLARRLGVTA